ncbi:MAG: hypothetical protein NXH84_07595 [Rhodobacteraceae bacterium]|nr:hypothetical protein [Paracoccaceae bacterium]
MTDTAFVIRRSRRRTAQPEGRFEYRVWPRISPPAVSHLHRFWPLTHAERRSDIYLVHPGSDRALVKLRGGGRLEMKRHDCDVGRIQHWVMAVSTGFPLSVQRLEELAGALSLRDGLPATAGLSPAHLVAQWDALSGTIGAQTVQKSRLLFQRDECRAEICRVSMAGWRGLTIALEAEDLGAMTAALDELQLGTLPNRSYGEALLRFSSMQDRRRTLLPIS